MGEGQLVAMEMSLPSSRSNQKRRQGVEALSHVSGRAFFFLFDE